MSDKLVDILLDVKVEQGAMVAYLHFSNVASRKIYLDEQTICFYKKTYGDVFEIKDERGKIVEYNGMMVARKIDPAYFQQLNPGEKLETSVNISEVYKMKKGKKYSIQYCGDNPYYKDEQQSMEMQSNKVEIVYS